jgi:hypothetical protein
MNARRAERVYALLLHAYPSAFRATYAREMTLAFRDLARDAGRTGPAFWLEIAADVARSAPALRLEAVQRRLTLIGIGGRIMRAIGLLAIVVGILETANTLTELAAGGIAGRGMAGSIALLLAIIGGVLLVAAGFALRHAHAIWARNAAIVCLALFILARTLAPWMSIASTVIGVVFPLALLVWTTRRRSSAVSV